MQPYQQYLPSKLSSKASFIDEEKYSMGKKYYCLKVIELRKYSQMSGEYGIFDYQSHLDSSGQQL